MRCKVSLVLCLLVSLSAVRAQPSEKDAVLATVNKLFDGMRARDRALLLSAFDESARLVRVRDQNGLPAVTSLSMDRFADSVVAAKAGDVWDERLRDPEVRIDGTLAQVWGFYTFRLNGNITSCGTDAFMLLKVGATWKITQVADTQRRDNCDK